MASSTPSNSAATGGRDGAPLNERTFGAPIQGHSELDSQPARASANVFFHQPPPKTFTPFPEFPTELRLKIWKEACLFVRLVDIQPVVVIQARGADGLSAGFHRNKEVFEYKTWSKIPPILHTSLEARSVGLENYSLEFGTEYSKVCGRTTITVKHSPKIYINWACDVPCIFPLPSVMPLADIKKDLATRTSMKRLSIDIEYLFSRPPALTSQAELLQLFRSLNLEEMSVFHGYIPVMGCLKITDAEWAAKSRAKCHVLSTNDLGIWHPVVGSLITSKLKVRDAERAAGGLTAILNRLSDPRHPNHKKDWVPPLVYPTILDLEC